MLTDSRIDLLAPLADTDLQIRSAAARISGPLSDADWRGVLQQVIELRKLREELEAKLTALAV